MVRIKKFTHHGQLDPPVAWTFLCSEILWFPKSHLSNSKSRWLSKPTTNKTWKVPFQTICTSPFQKPAIDSYQAVHLVAMSHDHSRKNCATSSLFLYLLNHDLIAESPFAGVPGLIPGTTKRVSPADGAAVGMTDISPMQLCWIISPDARLETVEVAHTSDKWWPNCRNNWGTHSVNNAHTHTDTCTTSLVVSLSITSKKNQRTDHDNFAAMLLQNYCNITKSDLQNLQSLSMFDSGKLCIDIRMGNELEPATTSWAAALVLLTVRKTPVVVRG